MPQDIRSFVKQRRDQQTRPADIRSFVANRREQPQHPPQPEVGFLENLRIGAEQGFQEYILNPALSGLEALGSAVIGDFTPAREIAELTGRGALKFVSAFDPAGAAYEAESKIQDPQINRILTERQARRSGDVLFEAVGQAQRDIEAEAARDPSLTGRITRGVGQFAVGAAPAVATGIASGGSIPAIAGVTAAQSLDQPQNLAANVALASAPVPAVVPILRRVRSLRSGRAAPSAQGVVSRVNPLEESALREAEGLPALEAATPRAGVRATGPAGAFEAELQAVDIDPLLVSQAERTPVLETISAFRKAGLLTGAKTHLKNLGGNLGYQLSEEAARIPAAIIDSVVSLKTGRRTITGPSVRSMARSSYEAATKGAGEAWDIIRTGSAADDLARLGLDQEIRSGNQILDTYINGTFRLLNAEDKLFRTYAMRRSIEDRARAQALTEARAGEIGRGDFAKRTRELIEQPPENIVADAALDAEAAVFAERNRLAEGISAFKEKQGQIGKFGVDMIIPFPRTPTNIIKRMIEYAGGGYGNAALKLARAATKGFTPAEQRAFVQTFGRANIGSGLIALGWKLYDAGLMTGLIEDDPTRRARDLAAGRTPGALRVGDRWLQLVGFAPGGSLLAIGATLARETRQEAGEDRATLPYLETAAQAIGEAPLLIGSKQIAETLRSPGAVGERTLGAAAGSFIPTLVSDIGEAIDPQQRDIRGQGITAATQKRIPGLRQSLPESVDVIGQPRQDFGPGQAMLDPTRATTAVERTNPLFAELVRLDAGISGFTQDKGETPEAYRDRVQRFGKLYGAAGLQLIGSPQYRSAPDTDRRGLFALLNSRSKSLVDDGREREAPALLSPAALLEALRLKRQRQAAASKQRR